MDTPVEGKINRILVVEDEPVIGNLCRRVLNVEGFKVDIAINGKVAQDMVGENQYELILIDFRIPVMNGKDFYEWLLNHHPELVGKVIFTSGDLINTGTKDFIENTGLVFLPKPFDSAQLITSIHKALDNPLPGKELITD